MSERYALQHEGTWFYHLGADRAHVGYHAEPFADGKPMQAAAVSGWFATDHEAERIEIRLPSRPVTVAHRLRDRAAASARYPLTLTPAEWSERADRDDGEYETLCHLYSPVSEPGETSAQEVEGPWLRLDGPPPPQDGLAWQAELPHMLANRAEYRHLFPGHLLGFREHMSEALKKLPNVQYVFDWKRGSTVCGLEVTLSLPFDKPVTDYKPARNLDGTVSRSRRGANVTVRATRKLELPVPYRIDGPDRAAATATWRELEAALVEAVTSATVAACSACRGHGYIEAGGPR